jgi:uncharacterized protein YqgC (DUF456 family)
MSGLIQQLPWLPIVALACCSLMGVVSILLTGGGTYFFLLGGLIYGWLTGFADVGPWTLAWLAALYGLGELLELLVTMATVSTLGASRRAAIGAALGGCAGAVLGLGVLGIGVLPGTLIGLFAGGAAGEWWATKSLQRSARAGIAGLASRVAVTLMKLAVALVMLVLVGMAIARQ